MTDQYKAGEFIIPVLLDASQFKGQLAALEKQTAEAGQRSGDSFGKALLSGFKAGQFGKRINDNIAKEWEDGADKVAQKAVDKMGAGFRSSLNALKFDKAGQQLELPFDKASISITEKLSGTFKKIPSLATGAFSKVKGAAIGFANSAKGAIGGLAKGLLKGGLIGIGLEVLNFGVRKLADGFKNGFTKAARAASAAAKLVHKEQSRVNDVFKQTDGFLEKYSQKSDIATESLKKFKKAGKSLGKIGSVGVKFVSGNVESYLEKLDQVETGQDGLEASIKKYAIAQRLAFAADATENYARVLGEIEEQEKRLADLQNKPSKHADEIKIVQSRLKELQSDLENIEETSTQILAQPDSAFTKAIEKNVSALKDQNDLALAKASLDNAEVERLERKALVTSKTEELLRAYPAHLANSARAQEDATAAAEKYVKALERARKEGDAKRRAEEYRLALSKRQTSELRDQLAIEQGKGDGADQKVVKALETQLLLEQKIAEYKDAKFANYEERAKIYVASMDRAKEAAEKAVQDANGITLKAELNLELAQAGELAEWQKLLERQQKEADLTARYEDAGHDTERANELAQQHLYNLDLLMAQREEREMLGALAERDMQLALEKARHEKDFDEVERLEKEIELQNKIKELKDLGFSDDAALKRAEQELVLFNLEKEIEARVAKNAEMIAELESELALAKVRGESTLIEDLEKQIKLLKERRKYIEEGQSLTDASTSAQGDIEDEKLVKLRGEVKDLFKDGIKAAVDGDFKEFLADKLQGAADKMFDNAIDTMLDSLLSSDGPLGGLLEGLVSGKDGGALGGLGSLFAGFFADGGVVPRGQFAIVGERGPEIISAGASPLRVTPMNDNYAATATAGMVPDGGGVRAMSYAPVNNFYGHTQDDLKRSLDERDRALKSEMPGMMDRHSFNRNRGMA